MKAADFDYRITHPELKGRTGIPEYDAEPSLRMLINKYYSVHFDEVKAAEYTERYIAQMLSEGK